MSVKIPQNSLKAGRRVLGRGLDSLFGEIPPLSPQPSKKSATQSTVPPLFLPIEQLESGSHQPRSVFDKEALKELAQSIKENGLIQPIVIRKKGFEKYEIIAGERRWRAAGMAGLHKVPVWFANDKQKTEKNRSVLALVENIQRQNLSCIEVARAYKNIIQQHKLTQEQLAQQLGVARTSVTNHLRLFDLDVKVQELLANKKLSFGLAKILLQEKNYKQQIRMALYFISNNLGVREAEKFLQSQTKTKNKKSIHTPDKSPTWQKQALKKIQDKHGTKTSLKFKKKGGELCLRFYSDEELHYLMDLLLCPPSKK